MEPDYINETVMDAAGCRDFLALSWGQNNRVVRLLLVGVGLFAFGSGIYRLAFLRPDETATGLALLALGALALFLSFFGYLLQAPGYTRRQQRAWGGPTLEKQLLFYAGHLEQQSRLGTHRFAYSQLCRLRHNRRAYLLQFEGGAALLLGAGGFTKGQPEEWAQMLRQKIQENKSEKKRNKNAK